MTGFTVLLIKYNKYNLGEHTKHLSKTSTIIPSPDFWILLHWFYAALQSYIVYFTADWNRKSGIILLALTDSFLGCKTVTFSDWPTFVFMMWFFLCACAWTRWTCFFHFDDLCLLWSCTCRWLSPVSNRVSGLAFLCGLLGGTLKVIEHSLLTNSHTQLFASVLNVKCLRTSLSPSWLWGKVSIGSRSEARASWLSVPTTAERTGD